MRERDGGRGPSLSVDVAASVDVHDLDRAGVLCDTVDHSVVASAGRVQACELSAERLVDSVCGLSASGPKMNSTQAVTIFSNSRCRSRSAQAVTRME